ncbi:4-hydroxy-tetrahydrodipicolinate synthase [Psychrosphaera ytuae]|uniref:4-hydroxy-tetrahydrodipicolinate synthase n=1 Tax=Psychrosphaera ytuae TaxID=2820710 RepID=A0A975HID8_9GAMM|nr:4-hydroxy-tetrahydrodipicolinate synthase [Psychrosphaera ytuae]QTH64107.1 4-hydroxy-tetrahydrodipicolinate synthase [Psychrosphaera ytuae]
MSLKEKFSGSFVALITPMSEQGEIDFDALSKLIEWHIENGTNGLVILGTTAETVTLTEQEKWAVLTHAIKINDGRLPIIVGNGSNCTATTIATTKKYNELAIDGYLTVTPYYNKPNQRGTVAHFKAVAEATDKPIILYNVPGRTNLDLSNDSVITLMAIKNIVGIKDATGDLDRVGVFKQASDEFVLLSGDDATSREFVRLGGHGTISVTANVAPHFVAEMITAARKGDSTLASSVDSKIEALHKDLFIEPNPVPAKFALKELGLISSDFVRLPLVELEPNSKNVIKQALQPIK